MQFFRIHTRAIVIGTVFMVVVVTISALIYLSLERWRQDVIRTNETLTKVVTEQLHQAARGVVDSLSRDSVFELQSLNTNEVHRLDMRLKSLSDSVFMNVRGMEGGFFITNLDEFYGYGYPTSPPPIPVYGPPPRSYAFIKNQVLETIDSTKPILRLHKFDPAFFPLGTEPVFVDGQVVAVVWARIHIERELPAIKLRQLFNIGALTSLLGFVIALLISITQRRKIQQMSLDLEHVKSGKAVQVTESKGTLGFIARSINAMVKTMRDENTRREKLERQLHQKQKMASLGKVIAGVAHEVKTPLAIIKTRIQMWQQALRDTNGEAQVRDVFSNESLQLVVDEVDRLSDLVRRLLLFSKPQPAFQEPTDLNDLLRQTITFSETRTSKERIQINAEFDRSLPKIPADRNALRQVFINIIVNSIEAIPGNGKIDIRTVYNAQRHMCTITFVDNGTGIPTEMRQSIFDPFVTTKKKGFGLGLSISYEIITAHGGSIQLFPNKIAGTTCVIELPTSEQGRDRYNETD